MRSDASQPFHFNRAIFFSLSPFRTIQPLADKSPKSAAGRANINNGMIMNQIAREKPISYWPAGANDWPRGLPARLPRFRDAAPARPSPSLSLSHPRSITTSSFHAVLELALVFPHSFPLSPFPGPSILLTHPFSVLVSSSSPHPRSVSLFFSPASSPGLIRRFALATRARSDNAHSAYFSINLNYKTSR